MMAPILASNRAFISDTARVQALLDAGDQFAARKLLKTLAANAQAEIACIDSAQAVLDAATVTLREGAM